MAYDLKDLTAAKGHQHQSLGQIFSIIEKAKEGMCEEGKLGDQEDIIPNSQEMMEAVQSEGLIVYRRDDEEKRQVNVSEGEIAYFALLASDMLEIAEKYKRDVDEVHRLFFEVSCDREKLIRLLDGQKLDK